MEVAVVAHRKKSFGGGLEELRARLAEAGVTEPQWYEVKKSAKAPRKVKKALARGATLLPVWGGDGTVQACVDAVLRAGAGEDVALAILPAGTANQLATTLGIAQDVGAAVEVALRGARRRLDVGVLNGEHFAVMAGTGFDAAMIREASRRMKKRVGRAAYVWSGLKNLRQRATRARVRIDGERWFDGPASCVLLGNAGTLMGGLTPFPDAALDDGLLEVGVVKADSGWQWIRVLARTAGGRAERSPLVETGRGAEIKIRLDRSRPYQLDGGDREAETRFVARVKPRALTVCVPAPPGAKADGPRVARTRRRR